MNLIFFNWPSYLGGADTKLVHLLPLLADGYRITLVPNNPKRLEEPVWREWCARYGFHACRLEELPESMEGWCVAMCNADMFSKGMAGEARRRGLRVAWSNEMMWHFESECASVMLGLVDTILYTSPVQRAALEPGYLEMITDDEGATPVFTETTAGQESGWLPRPDGGPPVRWVIAGNYVDPALFPYHEPRERGPDEPLVVGRLSRPDPAKFPGDFPAFYEGLGLRAPVRFRVMGWDEGVARAWPEHRFDDRWDLLAPAAEDSQAFLASLYIFVYSLGPEFKESWGRAVVEAMLTGVVPLVPRGGGHHLENLVPHGEGGFLCDGPEDYGRYARMLQDDPALLARMSRAARDWAVKKLCCAAEHRRIWDGIFHA